MEKQPMRISMIVAMANDGAIGIDNRMPWHMPRDLKNFKTTTMGHIILMGSNTFRSLPGGALSGRRNMVLSQSITALDGAEVYAKAEEAIATARESGERELFVIGGARIFELLLPLADRIYLTRIQHVFPDADTYFPQIDLSTWQKTSAKFWPKDEKNPYDTIDFVYDRK